MGFSDYFLVVADFLQVGQKIGHMPLDRIEHLRAHMTEMSIEEMISYIEEDMSYPGFTIGIGRGSGAGSVVAYVNYITNVEPTQYDLLFERFLNPERVSMPDFDSDLSKAEAPYGVRDIVIEYVGKKYGYDGVCGICTPSTLAPKAAVMNTANILVDREFQKKKGFKEGDYIPNSEKDPVWVEINKHYTDLSKAIRADIPEDPGTTFSSEMEDGSTLYESLKMKYAGSKDATEIIELANMLDGVNDNYGKHAAGVIIADNGNVGEYGALMYDDESNGWKIQMNAVECEDTAGLLKMDFLGLKTLNIITMALRLIYENRGIYINVENLPDDPEVYSKIFATGNTVEVFQFSSNGMKQMLKKFKPDKFDDLTLLNATFRPGPMKYIDPIADKKHGRPVETSAFDKVPQIQELLAPTYGYPVYQEQVMRIFQIMGQYSIGGADEIRRAMSKKKQYIIAENREIFVHGGEMENHRTHKSIHVGGAMELGIAEDTAYEVFDALSDFAKYGFNKSHSLAYAKTAYMTAWLKLHYPIEFYTACLCIEENKEMAAILADAKANGVKIAPVDINTSRAGFTCDTEQIYFGFAGVSMEKATQNLTHDYVSVADFILRGGIKGSKLEGLVKVGAFDNFTTSRKALLEVLPVYAEHMEAIKKAQANVTKYTNILADMEADPEGKTLLKKYDRKSWPKKEEAQTRLENAKESLDFHTKAIKAQVIPMQQFKDTMYERLQAEKDLCGLYLTGHPVDMYGTPKDNGCMEIINSTGNCHIMGQISNLRICSTKADASKKLAFFDIEDQTDKIHVCCFTESFNNNGSKLANDMVVKLSGTVKADKQDPDTLQFILNKGDKSVIPLAVAKSEFTFNIKDLTQLKELQDKLSDFEMAGGHPAYIYDMSTGDRMKLDICLMDEAENIRVA